MAPPPPLPVGRVTTSLFDPARGRYERGEYDVNFGDDDWKAGQMARLLAHIPDLASIRSYADVGCGNGGVFANLIPLLHRRGALLQRTVGYDIAPCVETARTRYPHLVFKQLDFLQDDEAFDLVTLNDLVEHLVSPQEFLAEVRRRARYVALHIPLDDRWGVLLASQFNARLRATGHISFWNPATAINLLSASGLLPMYCRFTPGFLAPSGRATILRVLALPLRLLVWTISPPLAAVTIGGVSLAVLCRGGRAHVTPPASRGC